MRQSIKFIAGAMLLCLLCTASANAAPKTDVRNHGLERSEKVRRHHPDNRMNRANKPCTHHWVPCMHPKSGLVTRRFSNSAGGTRSFYVKLPNNYRIGKSYRLVLVFAGTDTTSTQMRNWFGLGWSSSAPGMETLMQDTIFIYPDQKWTWGNDRGWALGPYAGTYGGSHDIVFVDELLDYALFHYSIDANKVFATGHSWGGDMAAVVGCFLSDRFAAIAPVAANQPYWFDSPPNPAVCLDHNVPGASYPAVWTFFGKSDDYFGSASPNGWFGVLQNDFWRDRLSCSNATTTSGETTRYTACKSDLRLTLYASGQYSGGGSFLGHQPPDYFLSAVSSWFMSF